MSKAHHHDPVNALSEADATGRTAEIFADIREVMQIPLITSIWRSLAGVENGLETVWTATRPIFESGQPDAVLQKLKDTEIFPIPDPSPINRFEAAGVQADDRTVIVSLIDAYNRSNTLNLIALTALVSESESQPSNDSRPTTLAPWPVLPPLLPKENITATDWELLERIKLIGASNDEPALPTLWRHLIHWPRLLTLILESYSPLDQNGTIHRAIKEVSAFAESEAPALSRFKASTHEIPTDAFEMIRSYVGKPPSVTRMVTIGHGIARWLNG